MISVLVKQNNPCTIFEQTTVTIYILCIAYAIEISKDIYIYYVQSISV